MSAALLGLLLAGPLLYPLDHPPSVSSTFGAYRLSHHHAGLDLITGDDDTVQVLAAADGEVYKIRRNSGGYGRSLYVRHPNGQVTVYAHLSAFAPKLLPFVREFGAKGFKFKRNVKGIPVKRGEPLGWVGTSGTDLIHLHFEVREKGAPVNPLTHGLHIPDTQPPVFKRLLAYARTPKGHVNGGHDEVFLEFKDGKLEAPVRLDGDVALLVEVDDTIDGSPRMLRPHTLKLIIDGKTWYEGAYERTSYSDKGHTELDYDPWLRNQRVGVFHKLFREGPRLRNHKRARRHFRGLKDGTHEARLIAADAAGNRAEARFEIEAGPATPPCKLEKMNRKARREALKGPKLDWSAARWRERMVIIPLDPKICAEGKAPLAALDGDKRYGAFELTRLEGAPAVAVGFKASEDVNLKVLTPSGAFHIDAFNVEAGVELTRPGFGIEVDEKTGFFSFPSAHRVHANPGVEHLETVSRMHRLENGWRPTKGGIMVGFPVPKGADMTGLGLYMKDRDHWWYLGARPDKGLLYGWTVHLGDYALMRDIHAPTVGEPIIEDHPGGRRLIVPIDDRGSGLLKFFVQVDDQGIDPEWSRAFKRLIYLPIEAKGLEPGPHTIDIQAWDRSGRFTKASRAFEWPARKEKH